VFEKGWGVELIGLDHSIPIVSFVPLLMFAILFGLSMDYQVFLVSRIHERFEALDEDNHEAVVEGLATSARVITSAALIMVCVFSSFILTDDAIIKQFGVGLSVAVLLASTMVLSLAPAMLTLFGGAVWWLPGWLSRLLPHVDIEGETRPPTPGPALQPQLED
jgi:putative drug exporter of the RND superfamily